MMAISAALRSCRWRYDWLWLITSIADLRRIVNKGMIFSFFSKLNARLCQDPTRMVVHLRQYQFNKSKARGTTHYSTVENST